MKWVSVSWAGKIIRVPALKVQGRLWLHWQGETRVIDLTQGERRSTNSKSKLQSGQIIAPMPGKVTKVFVKTGDLVVIGQALVVMEAMKMEYTLEATQDGKVADILAQAGAQVALGEVLLKVGEA